MSGTTWVSQYQKGKTNLYFTEARDSEWQWHPLGHMQDSTSLQSENHASTPPLSFLQAGCPSCHPTNSVKALKARKQQSSRIKSQTSFQYPKPTYLRNLLLQEKSRQPPFSANPSHCSLSFSSSGLTTRFPRLLLLLLSISVFTFSFLHFLVVVSVW